MRDLLKELHDGLLSGDAAYDVYDEVMDADAANAPALLGLSAIEWTAFGHGASFEEIASWRYDGWPSTCAICGKPLDVNAFGWFARAISSGKHAPVHLDCLPPHPNHDD